MTVEDVDGLAPTPAYFAGEGGGGAEAERIPGGVGGPHAPLRSLEAKRDGSVQVPPSRGFSSLS